MACSRWQEHIIRIWPGGKQILSRTQAACSSMRGVCCASCLVLLDPVLQILASLHISYPYASLGVRSPHSSMKDFNGDVSEFNMASVTSTRRMFEGAVR